MNFVSAKIRRDEKIVRAHFYLSPFVFRHILNVWNVFFVAHTVSVLSLARFFVSLLSSGFFFGVLVSRCIEFGEKIAIVAGRTKANRTNSASHGNVEKSEDWRVDTIGRWRKREREMCVENIRKQVKVPNLNEFDCKWKQIFIVSSGFKCIISFVI